MSAAPRSASASSSSVGAMSSSSWVMSAFLHQDPGIDGFHPAGDLKAGAVHPRGDRRLLDVEELCSLGVAKAHDVDGYQRIPESVRQGGDVREDLPDLER